jgi:hypothetical protein
MLPPMAGRTWLGIGVGTLIVAVGIWFSIIALASSPVTALGIAAVAIVMCAYAMAAFSGAEDPAGTGFKAAVFGLITGAGMFGMFLATNSDVFVVAAPVAAIGASGIYALVPTDPIARRSMRLAALGIGSTIVWAVFTVDPTVYGVIVPLIPLPAIGFADRVFDRAVVVIAEDPLGTTDEESV